MSVCLSVCLNYTELFIESLRAFRPTLLLVFAVRYLGSFGAVVGRLRVVLGPLGLLLGPLGRVSGASWGDLWASWSGLGTSWDGLGSYVASS